MQVINTNIILFINRKPISLQEDEYLGILQTIKVTGNQLFAQNDFINACRKYKKAVRYYHFFAEKLRSRELNDGTGKKQNRILEKFYIKIQLNIAAVELKLEHFILARNACDEVSY